MELTTQQMDAATGALARTEELPPQERAEAVVRAAVGAADQPTTNVLWLLVVAGLVGVVLISVLGIVLDEGDGDTVLTIFTTTLAGLLGLFAPSPNRTSAGGA